MKSSAYMRPLESQLQQNNAAFSVRNSACESLGSSGHIRQSDPQWQPKEAAILVSNNRDLEQISSKNQAWERLNKESSQLDKGTRSEVHESNKEFGRMLHEQLQEFAMILTKEYNYKFPVEFFDDYYGNFNKEEFLGIEQPKEKLRWQKADPLPTSNVEWKKSTNLGGIDNEGDCNDSAFSNSNNYGGLDQCVWSKEGLKEHIGSFREEEMMETTNQKTEMAGGNKESRGLVINSAAVIENLEEGIRPSNSPINRLEEEIGKPQCKDIVAAIPGGASHIVEASSDIAEKEVHIGGNFSKQEGKGVVVNHFGKEDQCGGYVAAPKEALAGIEVAADPRSHVQGQPWSDYPRQANKSSLLHSQEVAEIFAEEHGCRMDGNTKTAAMGMSLPCLLVWGSDKLPKKVMDTAISSSRLQISVVLFDQWRVIDFGCVLVEMDMRTTAVTIIFVSIEENPSTKKKKPRRRKWEKEIKQKMKVGIG